MTQTSKIKRCSKCQTVKALSEFTKDKSRKDNLTVWCKSCCSASYFKNVKKNREYRKDYSKKRYAERGCYWYTKRPQNHQEGSVRYEARMAGYRSGFERSFAFDLQSRGIKFEYEPVKVPYIVEHIYNPDFYIVHKNILIETKGNLEPADRGKHLMVRAQHPELDIRFIFQMADKKMIRSKMTHKQWADKHGFKWAEGTLPESWLNE